jgi:DNA transformation protein
MAVIKSRLKTSSAEFKTAVRQGGATKKRHQGRGQGKEWGRKEKDALKAPIKDQYARQPSAYDATARLRNIGPTSSRWLAAVGIHTLDDLKQIGVVNAYNLVKLHGYNATLNLLWALQGAFTGVHWTKVPERVKRQLKARLEIPS